VVLLPGLVDILKSVIINVLSLFKPYPLKCKTKIAKVEKKPKSKKISFSIL